MIDMKNIHTRFVYTTDGKTFHRLETQRPILVTDAFRRIKNCRSIWVEEYFWMDKRRK